MGDQPPQSPGERAERRFVEDFSVLLDRADFRRWLFYVIDSPDYCHSEGLSSMDKTSRRLLPPDQVYFADGQRSVGIALKVTIQRLAPERFMQMLHEQMGLRNQQPSPPVEVTKK